MLYYWDICQYTTHFVWCCCFILTVIVIPSYVQSACKLFKAAEECRLDRDEEKSYVLYMKYLTVYDIIKKRPDFKSQLVWLASINHGVFLCYSTY